MSSAAKTSVKLAYLHLRKVLLVGGARMLRPRLTSSVTAPAELRKILFIRTDRIGDMVLSTPALRAIRHALPGVHLTVLASRSNAPLLQHDPHVDRVLVWNQARRSVAPIEFLLQVRRLAKARYDAVIDPMTGPDLHTALIAWFSRAPIRIGFSGYGREAFFTRLCCPEKGRHTAELVLESARPLGVRSNDCMPHLRLLPAERLQARSQLTAIGLSSRPVVAIHPGAHYPSQRWPTDYFARLAQQLKKDCRHSVVLLGGPDDRPLIARIRGSIGEGVAVFENHGLRQTAALIAEADALVCNNSGPLHLAVALGVPTLSFMGPTEQSHWAPLGPQHVVLRQDRLDCIGCNHGSCVRGDHACMRMITPEAALNHLLSLLRQPQTQSTTCLAAASPCPGSLQTLGRRCGAARQSSTAPA